MPLFISYLYLSIFFLFFCFDIWTIILCATFIRKPGGGIYDKHRFTLHLVNLWPVLSSSARVSVCACIRPPRNPPPNPVKSCLVGGTDRYTYKILMKRSNLKYKWMFHFFSFLSFFFFFAFKKFTSSILTCIHPGKGIAPSPTPRCSCYWKRSLRIALDTRYWHANG